MPLGIGGSTSMTDLICNGGKRIDGKEWMNLFLGSAAALVISMSVMQPALAGPEYLLCKIPPVQDPMYPAYANGVVLHLLINKGENAITAFDNGKAEIFNHVYVSPTEISGITSSYKLTINRYSGEADFYTVRMVAGDALQRYYGKGMCNLDPNPEKPRF